MDSTASSISLTEEFPDYPVGPSPISLEPFLDDEEPIELKICVLGDAYVGKTSLVQRFTSGTFNGNTESTVRISFQTKNLVLEGKNVKCNIWDTAGQEKYRSLAPIYYRGADAALIVYDISDENSLIILQYWMKQLRNWMLKQRSDMTIGIAGNKVDLGDGSRKFTRAQGLALADEVGALYEETSAKDGTNVNKLFIELARRSLRKRESDDGSGGDDRSGDVVGLHKETHRHDVPEQGCAC